MSGQWTEVREIAQKLAILGSSLAERVSAGKRFSLEGDRLEKVAKALNSQVLRLEALASQEGSSTDADDLLKRVNALGALRRAGANWEDSLKVVGLPPIALIPDLLPVTVRPTDEAIEDTDRAAHRRLID